VSIVTQYPFWYILACLAAGLLYAMLLYYRERSNAFPPAFRWGMGISRFLVTSAIAFLLLSPLVKHLRLHREKPIIIMAMDNSASVGMGEDSAQQRSFIRTEWALLHDELSKDFELRTFLFGDGVKEASTPSFSEKYTDASLLMQELEARFVNRNVGALLLATDGLFNRGSNPAYDKEEYAYPVFSIALGDTMQQRDIRISRLYYNRISYLGNDFPVEVVVQAHGYQDQPLRLEIRNRGRVLQSHTITPASEAFSTILDLRLTAAEPGVQRYEFHLLPKEGEVSETNNLQEAFVEVLDARQKVLILAHAAHPDISALRQAIESNEGFEVQLEMAAESNANPEDYNLIILHQLPSQAYPIRSLLERIRIQDVPVWLVLGPQTNLMVLSLLETGLVMRDVKPGFNDARAFADVNFSLFTLPPGWAERAGDYPPLSVPFADYEARGNLQTLFYQDIGKVKTPYPLLTFRHQGGQRLAVLAGEGIWRWRLQHYRMYGDHRGFDRLITQSVQYLSQRADKSRFRVLAEYTYPENTAVRMEAELYNETYELVNEPDVSLKLMDDSSRTYPLNFSRKGMAYSLDAGVLAPGNYTYSAEVSYGGELLQSSGSFVVSPVLIELMQTRADHSSLHRISGKSGGKLLYPDELKRLPEILRSKEDIKPIVSQKKIYSEIIHLKWIFALLLLLLTFEWFFRRWLGSY